ncbi:MAG: AtpZ/AtpI family protein [Actinomycetes bacterium]
MADDPPQDTAGDTPPERPFREVDGWAVVSYLITGVLFYGAIGWLIDAWLGTRGFVAGGIVVGAAAGVVLVWLRYSKS